jgi:hypothetical protein
MSVIKARHATAELNIIIFSLYRHLFTRLPLYYAYKPGLQRQRLQEKILGDSEPRTKHLKRVLFFILIDTSAKL